MRSNAIAKQSAVRADSRERNFIRVSSSVTGCQGAGCTVRIVGFLFRKKGGARPDQPFVGLCRICLAKRRCQRSRSLLPDLVKLMCLKT